MYRRLKTRQPIEREGSRLRMRLGSVDVARPLRLGQSSAQFESSAAWYDLQGKFRDAHRQLVAAEDLFRRDAQGSGLDGRELIRLRNELTALQSDFQYWWTLAFGAPANLSGLGAMGAIPLAAAGAAALIAAKLATMRVSR